MGDAHDGAQSPTSVLAGGRVMSVFRFTPGVSPVGMPSKTASTGRTQRSGESVRKITENTKPPNDEKKVYLSGRWGSGTEVNMGQVG